MAVVARVFHLAADDYQLAVIQNGFGASDATFDLRNTDLLIGNPTVGGHQGERQVLVADQWTLEQADLGADTAGLGVVMRHDAQQAAVFTFNDVVLYRRERAAIDVAGCQSRGLFVGIDRNEAPEIDRDAAGNCNDGAGEDFGAAKRRQEAVEDLQIVVRGNEAKGRAIAWKLAGVAIGGRCDAVCLTEGDAAQDIVIERKTKSTGIAGEGSQVKTRRLIVGRTNIGHRAFEGHGGVEHGQNDFVHVGADLLEHPARCLDCHIPSYGIDGVVADLLLGVETAAARRKGALLAAHLGLTGEVRNLRGIDTPAQQALCRAGDWHEDLQSHRQFVLQHEPEVLLGLHIAAAAGRSAGGRLARSGSLADTTYADLVATLADTARGG